MNLTRFQINVLTAGAVAVGAFLLIRRAIPEGGDLRDGAISLTRFTPIGALARLFEGERNVQTAVPDETRFGTPTFLDVAAGTQDDAGEIAAGHRKQRRDG